MHVIVCLSSLLTFGQNDLKLTLVKKSDQPITEIERDFLFQIENNSRNDQTIILEATNLLCSDTGRALQANLYHTFLKEDKNTVISSPNIKSGESLNFYLRISRPNNTKLNSWNCTKLIIKTDNNLESNSITIKTLVPDPKDFN